MFEKLFNLKKFKKKDFKTIQFYKFALSMKATEEMDIENINIPYLLSSSHDFLLQDKILTKKQEQEFNILKDKYNSYLDYCIEEKKIKKDEFAKVDKLNTFTEPDMSKIEVPDIHKELEEMDIDLDEIAKLFSNLAKK
jgi:hypothetical protein